MSTRRGKNYDGHGPEANGSREELLRTLLEELDEGVANVSPDGQILYANSRFAQLMNFDPRRLVLRSNLRDFITPASWDDLSAALTAGATQAVQGQTKVNIENNRLRTVRLSLSPVCVGQDTTISVAATDITELVEYRRALQESETSLHSLSARIMQLRDEERRRIARDLHDITGQELAVVIMSLNRVLKDLERPEFNLRKQITEAVELVRKVEDEVRSLSYLLHPPLLDEFGLGSALQWYAEGFKKRSGIDVEVCCPHGMARLPGEKEIALFRVVQESLTNVMRHSGSRKAWIRLSCDRGVVRLSVQDEGYGINSKKRLETKEHAHTPGVGILGMRERMHQLGGGLEICHRPRGTEVIANLPAGDGDRAASESAAPVTQDARESFGGGATLSQEAPIRKRILIADDHEVTRHGIRTLLQDEPDLEICGEAQDGLDAVSKTRDLRPDLVIMDISMPLAGGFSAANSIRRSGLPAKILFITTHTLGELESLSRTAGFEGFVYKTNAAHDLLRGVRAVLSGNRFFNSQIIRTQSA